MSFNDSISALPFTSTEDTARGFLPPIVRAMGHMLYLSARYAEPRKPTIANAATELQEALNHWNGTVSSDHLSVRIREQAGRVGVALSEAVEEFSTWTNEQRTENLRNLTNRMVQLAADMDRELIGILNSDPGNLL